MDIRGHRRRGQLGPLAALPGPPGAAVHPGHVPGCPPRCDIHKLQRHHQQNVPKCRGSWSPAARPQKLCPGGQEPCKQQESRLPATHPARGSWPGGRASRASREGYWPHPPRAAPLSSSAAALHLGRETTAEPPGVDQTQPGVGCGRPAASTLVLGAGSDLCRAERLWAGLPGGGLRASGSAPPSPAGRQPHFWSHQVQGSAHPKTRISRVKRCTLHHTVWPSHGTVTAKQSGHLHGAAVHVEKALRGETVMGAAHGDPHRSQPRPSCSQGRPTTTPRQVCDEAPEGRQHTG